MNDREKKLSIITMSKVNNACYVSDIESYELLFLNECAKKMFGIENDDYMGRKCYEVLIGASEVCEFCKNKQLIKDEYFKWEYFNPVIQRHFELIDTMFELDGREVKMQIGTDITNSKTEVEQLRIQLSLEETLIRCVQTLSEHNDIEIAIIRLLEIIGEFYDADRAFIFEICKDEKNISNTYEWTYSNTETQKEKLQQIPIAYFGNWLKKFEVDDAIYIESTREKVIFNYDRYVGLGLSGAETILASKLKIGSKTIGFLGVDNPKNNIRDKSLLHSVSLFVANDIKKKEMLIEFERFAIIDMFSGLYNRNKFLQTVDQIIADKIDAVGIVYFDINGLKQVNSDYGHEHGDRLILKVVSMMKECFSENLFRTGGDEFVALYINGSRNTFEEKLLHLRNIMSAQKEISFSVGSAWCNNTNDIVRQIAHADELMFVDKQSYYSNRQVNRKSYRATNISELHNAINANEFIILIQPKIRLADEKLIGGEALVRKKNGQGELILPDNFIPIYETDGIITLLDFFVLESVCKLLSEWKEKGHTLIPLSVNFSRITILEYRVAQKINDVCKKYDIDPKLITIELTEHIGNILFKSLNEILEEIKSFGFQISLDDFGREYANLSILSSIAFSEVKLDKSLINDIAYNPSTGIAIRCIVEMCNAYQPTDTVVEGIETYEQVVKLRELNCSLQVVQGYYYSKPLSTQDFLHYSLKHKA